MKLFATQFLVASIAAYMVDAIWSLALSDTMNPIDAIRDAIRFAFVFSMGALMQRRFW